MQEVVIFKDKKLLYLRTKRVSKSTLNLIELCILPFIETLQVQSDCP